MTIDDETLAIYRMVKIAAEDNQPCPSNQDMAAELGRSERFCSDRLADLEKGGFLTVHSRGGVRSVTITSTGRTTLTNRRTSRDKAARRILADGMETRRKAADGCRTLLRRQLETGAFWINDPDKLAAAWRLVMPMEEAA